MRGLFAALWLVLAAPAFADAPDAGVAEAPEDPLDALPDAEPEAWKAGVSKAELKLAEPFTVSVEIRHPAADTYELRPGVDFEPFGLREKKVETTGEASKTTTLKLELQPFKTGELQVPMLRFIVQGPEGARKLDVPPQTVTVLGVIDPAQGEPQMREDLRPLLNREVTRWWPLVALALLALAGGVAFYVSKRMNRPAPPPPPKPRDPPDVEALARLDALEAEQLVAQARHQEHYFRLTELLRDYLGRRYGFDALELTTDELLEELRRRQTPGLSYDELAVLLHDCDLVKFARVTPTDGEAKNVGELARKMVLKSRPLPEPKEVRS